MSKIADTFVIVLAVTLVTALEGTVELTKNHKPSIHFFILTSGNPIFLVMKFPELFYFALGKIQSNVEYAMKIGSLTAITIGLSASKAITKTRLEFFREAGSGYNIQAFFLAVNIVGFIEHSLQMLLAGAVAFWLRSGTVTWYSYVFNFWVMQWMTVSWALLLSIVVPISSAVLAIGFFAVFFGLLFSGGLPPVEFESTSNSAGVVSRASNCIQTNHPSLPWQTSMMRKIRFCPFSVVSSASRAILLSRWLCKSIVVFRNKPALLFMTSQSHFPWKRILSIWWTWLGTTRVWCSAPAMAGIGLSGLRFLWALRFGTLQLEPCRLAIALNKPRSRCEQSSRKSNQFTRILCFAPCAFISLAC